MNQTELIEKIAKEHELSKAKAERIVKSVFSAIGESLSKGEEVRLSELGIFKFGHRSERKGRNPKTGETLTIPPKKVVRFVATKHIREAINTVGAGK
jgi:DNA-binding protein HU-beta